MKRTAIILALFAVSFAALGVTDALARHHGRGAMGGEGPDVGFGMIRMLDRLDLTQDQQGQVASLLKTHRGEIEQAMNDMVQGRSSLRDAMNAAEVSEENVKKAARVVADQHEQMILLWARIMSGMRDILTPEQNTRFQSLANKRGSRMQGFVEKRMFALDQWIAEHGK